jgi:hypothetical protein
MEEGLGGPISQLEAEKKKFSKFKEKELKFFLFF